MDLNEAQTKKYKLEGEITGKLNDFMEETGLSIGSIDFRELIMADMSRKIIINLKIEVSLK